MVAIPGVQAVIVAVGIFAQHGTLLKAVVFRREHNGIGEESLTISCACTVGMV